MNCEKIVNEMTSNFCLPSLTNKAYDYINQLTRNGLQESQIVPFLLAIVVAPIDHALYAYNI